MTWTYHGVGVSSHQLRQKWGAQSCAITSFFVMVELPATVLEILEVNAAAAVVVVGVSASSNASSCMTSTGSLTSRSSRRSRSRSDNRDSHIMSSTSS